MVLKRSAIQTGGGLCARAAARARHAAGLEPRRVAFSDPPAEA